MSTYRSIAGDTVDSICFARYGATRQVVEQVLDVNPGLAAYGALLPSGVLITLPDDLVAESVDELVVRLWT